MGENMGKFNELDLGIQEYVAHLQDNYNTTASGQFINFTYEIGRKYVHIIMQHHHHFDGHPTQRSSHSWVMIADDKKFKQGDILKSATWRGPARNFSRGNVLCGGFKHIKWAGV
jgi:hypothetical protein